MIPAGYMAKHVAARPDWLAASRVDDIFSVSGCVSTDFADYIGCWKHNGYWLFDSPDLVRDVARQCAAELDDTQLFYYEVHEEQWDGDASAWQPFDPEPSFGLDVQVPAVSDFAGFDIVSFHAASSPECSPLSCNGLANEVATNRHCLLATLDDAKRLLESGRLGDCEPGPYRILSVHQVDWP